MLHNFIGDRLQDRIFSPGNANCGNQLKIRKSTRNKYPLNKSKSVGSSRLNILRILDWDHLTEGRRAWSVLVRREKELLLELVAYTIKLRRRITTQAS